MPLLRDCKVRTNIYITTNSTTRKDCKRFIYMITLKKAGILLFSVRKRVTGFHVEANFYHMEVFIPSIDVLVNVVHQIRFQWSLIAVVLLTSSLRPSLEAQLTVSHQTTPIIFTFFNPLNPIGDQHVISAYDIHKLVFNIFKCINQSYLRPTNFPI